MVMSYRRTLEKFVALDETIFWQFQRYNAKYTSKQASRARMSYVAGVSYPFDHFGLGAAPVPVATEELEYDIIAESISDVNVQIRNHNERLRLIDIGKLWMIQDDDTRFWSYARVDHYVDNVYAVNDRIVVHMQDKFNRLTEWFYEDPITVTETITSDGETWIVNNPCNFTVSDVTLRIRANATSGFTDPKVTNLETGYAFKSLRDSASANHEVRLRTRGPHIDWSPDNGSSYSNDFTNYDPTALEPGQRWGSFNLIPDDNQLQYAGVTPNCDVEITFYPFIA